MEQNERPQDGVRIDKGSQINLVVNTPDAEEDSIDLGRVFGSLTPENAQSLERLIFLRQI